jgi:putative aldouronate transport system permease protein
MQLKDKVKVNLSASKSNELNSELTFRGKLKRDKWLLLLALPGTLYYIIFRYLPMFGIIIAFEDFDFRKGIFGSEFVFLDNIILFVKNPSFINILKNTILLGLINVIVTLPFAILFALLLNELNNKYLKGLTQSISLMPYFIATVVVVGIAINLLAPGSGLINRFIKAFGGEEIYFIQSEGWFRPIYIITEIWQKNGWQAVIFIAAIVGIDPQLYEACEIDGGGRVRKLISITLPSIIPIISVMFVLRVGQIMSLSFEKTLMLQNPLTYGTSDIIDTYIYRRGFIYGDISYAAAVDVFKGTVALVFALSTNYVSKKLFNKGVF